MDRKRDFSGMVICALFILIGVAALWDTTTMLDRDSYVFPRAVAGLMIFFCLVYIVWQLVLPPKELTEALEAQTGERGGSTARRVGLVAVMLAASFVMPYLGFGITAVITFAALMALAMYEPWTRFRLIVFPLVGLAVVLGFQYLFGETFAVPLPEATIF